MGGDGAPPREVREGMDAGDECMGRILGTGWMVHCCNSGIEFQVWNWNSELSLGYGSLDWN